MNKDINRNKWNIVLGICGSAVRHNCIELHIGIFKITKMPEYGCCIGKENIKGFWWHRDIRIKGFFVNFIERENYEKQTK